MAKPKSHITHSGSVELLKLQGAVETDLQTPQGLQKFIIIPSNNPSIGRKKDGTPYLSISLFEYETPDEYQQTHVIRSSFPNKAARESVPKEQQDAYTPIVGNLKPAKSNGAAQNPYQQQGGYQQPQYAPQGGYQQPAYPQPQQPSYPAQQGGYAQPAYPQQPQYPAQGGYQPAPQGAGYQAQKPADISQMEDLPPADVHFNPSAPGGGIGWNR